MFPPVAHNRGFTLAELIVVIAIIVVLTMVLMPTRDVVRTGMTNRSCGNNQRQIVLAMGVYANETDGIWPCRPTLSDGSFAPKGSSCDGLATTIATFEFLVVQTGNQMTAKIFACPQTSLCHPALNSLNLTLDETAATHSAWVKACGSAKAELMPGYCYDWSVPTNATAERVVTADRGFDTMGHKTVVFVCYADNHVGLVKQVVNTAPKAPMTFPFASTAVPTSVYDNPEVSGSTPDNIYDGAGDGGNAMAGGTGSTTRAWVR